MRQCVLANVYVDNSSDPDAEPVKGRGKKSDAGIPGPCIVDTQKLVKSLTGTGPWEAIPRSAKVLHMQTDIKTCADGDSL